MAHPATARNAPPRARHFAGAPFSALHFVGRRGRPRYWGPAPATTYAQACAEGGRCGALLVAWLRDNPGPSGVALLAWVLRDAFTAPTGTDSIQTGYQAGLASAISLAICGLSLTTTTSEH